MIFRRDDRPSPEDASATLYYQVLCLFAVVLAFLVQLPRSMLLLNLFTLAVGLLSVLSRLRIGPPMYLLIVSVGLIARRFSFGFFPLPASDVSLDIFLAAVVLFYVISHYRLQSVDQVLIPAEPGSKHLKVLPPRRAGSLVSLTELVVLMVTIPFWAILAHIVWLWLNVPQGLAAVAAESFARAFSGRWQNDFLSRISQLLIAIWVAGILMIIIRTVFMRWKLGTMKKECSMLLLQDTLWRDTSGEQREVSDGLARAAGKIRRAQDKPHES